MQRGGTCLRCVASKKRNQDAAVSFPVRPEMLRGEHQQAQGTGGRFSGDHWMAVRPRASEIPSPSQDARHGEESLPVPWQHISAKKPQAQGLCCLILYSEHPFLSIQKIPK